MSVMRVAFYLQFFFIRQTLRALGLVFIFSIPLFAQAQEMLGGLTPPKFQMPSLSYSGRMYSESDFETSKNQISFQTLSLFVPLHKTDTKAIAFTFGGSQLSVRPAKTDMSEFYDIRFGLNYTESLSDNRLVSVSARYGSASDSPFKDASASTIGATAVYSYPSSGDNRWMLLLDYSNNRPILNNIPLPGFAYLHNPTKNIRAVYGIPFATINWKLSDLWSLDGFTLIPWVIKGSLNYHVTSFAQVSLGMDFSQITFYQEDRQNKDDRLFYDEKKLFLMAKSPLSKNVFAELEIGHAFDRHFFSAENYELNPKNSLEIGNAFYAKIGFRLVSY